MRSGGYVGTDADENKLRKTKVIEANARLLNRCEEVRAILEFEHPP
jgi:hypothetical protein